MLKQFLTSLGLTVGVLISLWATPGLAQNNQHPFGLGLVGGDPSGFTGKIWLDQNDALQGTIGWHSSYYRNSTWVAKGGGMLSVDYTRHFKRFGPANRKVWFRFHVGGGVAMGTFDGPRCYYDVFGRAYCPNSSTLAVIGHVPLGFNVYLQRVRFEFFAELAPGVRMIPDFLPVVSAQMGARYYF